MCSYIIRKVPDATGLRNRNFSDDDYDDGHHYRDDDKHSGPPHQSVI